MNIPDNKYCPICGGITEYNCKTIMRHNLDCKCSGVALKYKIFEQQERAREMKKCSHLWEFSSVDPTTFSNPCAYYKCSRCRVTHLIDLKHPETIHLILDKDDCKGKEEPTLRDRVAYLRGLKSPFNQIGDALANISDRLDNHEELIDGLVSESVERMNDT